MTPPIVLTPEGLVLLRKWAVEQAIACSTAGDYMLRAEHIERWILRPHNIPWREAVASPA